MKEQEHLNENLLYLAEDPTQKKYTIDQAFEKIGGYSQLALTFNLVHIDRYHLFVSFVLIVGYASGGTVFL